MRIAIFSDVHGNLTALEAVLAHIDQQAPDMIAFAGDLCLIGPRGSECIERVRDRNIISVYGNTDLWVLDPPVPEGEGDEFRQHLYEISQWTQSQLDDNDLTWLRTRPFALRFSPTAEVQDDLLIVHANPRDVNQPIYPSFAKQRELFGEITQEQLDEDLTPLLEDVLAGMIAYGHVHVPNVRQWEGLVLANISSASMALDGDPRAKYGLLNWEKGDGWSVEHQYVSYDIDREIDALAAAQQPKWESYAQRLKSAGT